MQKTCTAAICFIAVFLLYFYPSYAALQSSKSKISPESTWNPNPADDDLLIPLPCGQQMALRAVAVPAGGAMQDRAFSMGIKEEEIKKNDSRVRKFYESRFDAYIAAPFSRADLPKKWQKQIPKQIPDDDAFRYYMLGKYEVSEYQWNAVMNEQCPPPPAAGANLPKRDISWYEITAFLHRLNLWLLKNKLQWLPAFKDDPRNVGFLRLPTEEEWEFAARGGNEQNFPLDGGQIADFCIFSAEKSIKYDNPLPIGSRKPNPLGLYDTVGNVKELTQSFFRFSVADQHADSEIYRLHGSAGGMLCKGGSFMSKKPYDVLPGWRDEVPLLTKLGEVRQRDMGFRVALSGINVPSGQRLTELVNAADRERAAPEAMSPAQTSASATSETSRNNQSMSKINSGQSDKVITINPSGDPVHELDRISDVASPEMRANLNYLRGLLEDQKLAEARRRELAYEKNLRSMLYHAEFLYDLDILYREQHHAALPETEGNKDLLNEISFTIDTMLSFFRSEAMNLAAAPEASTTRIFGKLYAEYKGNKTYNSHMRQNLDIARDYINLARQKKLDTELDKKHFPTLHNYFALRSPARVTSP